MRLAQNPDKQEKLQEELDRVLGNGEQVLSPDHIKELRYLKACVKEALRWEGINLAIGENKCQGLNLNHEGYYLVSSLAYDGIHFYPSSRMTWPSRQEEKSAWGAGDVKMPSWVKKSRKLYYKSLNISKK